MDQMNFTVTLNHQSQVLKLDTIDARFVSSSAKVRKAEWSPAKIPGVVFDLTRAADICPDGVLAQEQLQMDNGPIVETTNKPQG